jgi:hypothetical protein
MIVRRVSGGRTEEDVVEALIGEGSSSLFPYIPEDAERPSFEDPMADAQRRWNAELARYRDQAEALCEASIRSQTPPEPMPPRAETLEQPPKPWTPRWFASRAASPNETRSSAK